METFEVKTYTAPEDGWLSSSHYFVTPDGICLFDAQLLVDYASALLDQIRTDYPDTPLKTMFITCPNPEHYLAGAVFASQPEIRIRAAKNAVSKIARQGPGWIDELATREKSRAPKELIKPEALTKNVREYKWKDLTLEILSIGAKRESDNLVGFIPKKRLMLAGDLIYNRVHPDLSTVDIDQWRQHLRVLRDFNPKTVFPGHGPPVAGEVISHLLRYLDHFQMAVSYFGRGKVLLNEDDRSSIISAMHDKYPDYLLIDNLDNGVQPEFNRQRGQKAA